jgi:hypothetical protein
LLGEPFARGKFEPKGREAQPKAATATRPSSNFKFLSRLRSTMQTMAESTSVAISYVPSQHSQLTGTWAAFNFLQAMGMGSPETAEKADDSCRALGAAGFSFLRRTH